MTNEIQRFTVVPRRREETLAEHPNLENRISAIKTLINQAKITGGKIIILNGAHSSGKTLVLKHIQESAPNTYYCNFNIEYLRENESKNPEDFLFSKYFKKNGFNYPSDEIQIFILDHIELLLKYFINDTQNFSERIDRFLNYQIAAYAKNESLLFLISIPTEFINLSKEFDKCGYLEIVFL